MTPTGAVYSKLGVFHRLHKRKGPAYKLAHVISLKVNFFADGQPIAFIVFRNLCSNLSPPIGRQEHRIPAFWTLKTAQSGYE